MLDILYRDEALVAINKPAGLLVHRSDIDRHETRYAVQLLRDQIGRRVFPLHRLDKPASGVLLFALDADTARAVGGQFERNEIGKRYLAIVRGWPPAEGNIDHPLSRQFDDRGPNHRRNHGRNQDGSHDRNFEPASAPEPLPAVTDYRRLAQVELQEAVDRYPTSRYALVELRPATGRQHQLRRHMKHIAHPIIGDANWGKGVHNRFFQQRFDCKRLLLACTGLELRHPQHGTKLSLVAPLQPSFERIIAALGWNRIDY